MPDVNYDYDEADFPDGKCNTQTMRGEVLADAGILVACRDVQRPVDAPGKIRFVFADTLPTAEEDVLDGDTDPPTGLIAAHDNSATAQSVFPAQIIHTATDANPDGIPYSIPKSSGAGFILQDRDILVCMGKVTQATAVEDLKVATGTYNPADPYSAASVGDGSQADWGEAILRGCYKRVTPADPNGAYVECDDQADADALASLTIIDFLAGGPGTTATFEIKGGSLFPDMGSLGFTAGKEREHRIYAVMAPGTGADARFFDAYLEPYRLAKDWVPANSTDAMRVTATPPVDISSLVRVWIYSEPGYQGCHVLRMILYRT